MPETSSPPSSDGGATWHDVAHHAAALATALGALGGSEQSPAAVACRAYAEVVDEIVRMAADGGQGPIGTSVLTNGTPTQAELVAFGHLLRDRRNQAGLSRLQLARKAKISDSTVKFVETARFPPSRPTLLRLLGVQELGLQWSDTPGSSPKNAPADSEPDNALVATLYRLDSRLTVPLVLDLLLVLDEMHKCVSLIELTVHGARRACTVCGMRSSSWATDAKEAKKLAILHAAPCAGQLVAVLLQRHPVIAELAEEERLALRSDIATELAASYDATRVERFLGCRSSREVAAQLARVAALPLNTFRKGLSDLWLWALGLGPCPVEPSTDPFTERRASQIAQVGGSSADEARTKAIRQAAEWLVCPTAESPCDADQNRRA